jgi:hypothetical protein
MRKGLLLLMLGLLFFFSRGWAAGKDEEVLGLDDASMNSILDELVGQMGGSSSNTAVNFESPKKPSTPIQAPVESEPFSFAAEEPAAAPATGLETSVFEKSPTTTGKTAKRPSADEMMGLTSEGELATFAPAAPESQKPAPAVQPEMVSPTDEILGGSNEGLLETQEAPGTPAITEMTPVQETPPAMSEIPKPQPYVAPPIAESQTEMPFQTAAPEPFPANESEVELGAITLSTPEPEAYTPLAPSRERGPLWQSEDKIMSAGVAIEKQASDHLLITVGDVVVLPTSGAKRILPSEKYWVYKKVNKNFRSLRPGRATWFEQVGRIKILESNERLSMARVIAARDVIRQGDMVYLGGQ